MTASHDRLHRFLLEGAGVRGTLVRLTDAWHEVAARAEYPAALRELLGQALAGSALLTGNVRFRGSLSLQLKSAGPVTLLFAQCDHDQVRGLAQWRGEVPQPPLHPVPADGVAHGPGDDEARPRRRRVVGGERRTAGVHHQAGASGSDALAQRVAEVSRIAQPRLGRQHREPAQPARRPRPRRRRAEMIARPARVRMRRRKPWVRLRRRLLGWKVRLLTRVLPSSCCYPDQMRPPGRTVVSRQRLPNSTRRW